MNEIFRFMAIRSPQLADPSTAIDLTTYLSSTAPTSKVAKTGSLAKRVIPARKPSATATLLAGANLGSPKTPESLQYASVYDTLASKLHAPNFDPTTVATVVSASLGKTSLTTWVQSSKYGADKSDAAVALLAAHLRPPPDGRIDTLATYVRMMNLFDALAQGKIIADATTLSGYLHAIILAPSGFYPLSSVGPPYNPYVIPAGVADLQVVNQELLGYDKKEISFIANVLQSETNKRVTVRFEKTDQTYTTTTDTTTQTEQDSQSAERFQVQTQAQSTIQDDSNLKFGVSISASYGPSVNLKSNMDYGSSQATSDSQSVSTSYGKDITSRSVTKVTKEVTQQQRLDVVNSFKEVVEHGFNNANGTTNISGVYQYVDALYEVGVFNYGERLLLDLIVPDPAAFIRDAITAVNGGTINAYNPPSIAFTPANLTIPQALLGAGNLYPANAQWVVNRSVDYTVQAEIYQVQGLTPPPDPFITVAKPYNATATGSTPITIVSDTISIPAGYQAYSATVIAGISSTDPPAPAGPGWNAGNTYKQGDNVSYKGVEYVSLQGANKNNHPDTSPAWWASAFGYNLSVSVGSYFLQWGNGLWAGTLPNSVAGDTGFVGSGTRFTIPNLSERGTLPVTVSCGNILTYVVAIEVMCVMTVEAFAQWQLSTFTAINQAYLSLLSTYQEATGQNQQSLGGANYPGSSPDENQRVIQIELKREVISMTTLNQFDAPGAAAPYAVTTAYSAASIVNYNGTTYISLQNANQGNEPDTSPGWWSTNISQFNAPQAVGAYNPGTLYAAGAVVGYNGVAYISLQGGNSGNEPDTSPAWWDTNADTYVDVNLPPLPGQSSPATASDINFPVLFAQAPLIRFMEEGFEWDQMQYIFYPYYWNRKSEWFDLALLEDPDPLFTQFLRAGAARVVVPVRPGFEEAFLYFLQTGQPWDGGSVPQVYDPLYLSLATEIEEADQAPTAETLVGATWTMRLPTTLTMLRSLSPQIAPYAATAIYPIGAVVTYSGTCYIASQMPYDPGVTYAANAVVNYNDVSYTSIQSAYVPASAYSIGAVVSFAGTSYVSLQNANVGNEPDTSPAWWSPTANIGNEPDTSPAWWSATANTNFEPDENPAWWAPHDPSLPSWTLDSSLYVTASN